MAKEKWNGLCPASKHGLDFEGQACDLCPNLALAYLASISDASLDDWDGNCADLSDAVSQWLDAQGVPHRRLWLSPEGDEGLKRNASFVAAGGHEWRYHVVVEIEGVVHDAWYGTPLPRDEYLLRMFPEQSVVVEKF